MTHPSRSAVLPFARARAAEPGPGRLAELLFEIEGHCQALDALLDWTGRTGMQPSAEAQLALDELREALLPHIVREAPAAVDDMLAEMTTGHRGGVA